MLHLPNLIAFNKECITIKRYLIAKSNNNWLIALKPLVGTKYHTAMKNALNFNKNNNPLIEAKARNLEWKIARRLKNYLNQEGSL